ncbi:MAG TPA: E2/UBC family protein, partial [Balneolales bacterium]|nr:E2/UBC family protein [Balneolales bacterium]
MSLLLDSDYAALKERGIEIEEEEQKRTLILYDYPLPNGIYNEESCDVLVKIPQRYNQAGIDMFWTYPHLTRVDGNRIPRMEHPGSTNNEHFNETEFCRWSRHWNQGKTVWKA